MCVYIPYNPIHLPCITSLRAFVKKKRMSGVWVFKNGVVRLVENPGAEPLDGNRQGSSSARRKVLVHVPSNEVITCYEDLESKLLSLGWERYYDDPDLLQFHKRSTVHLISLPRDFNKFKSIHMYDIVVKNRNMFEVRDM
ncbi:hypothetical protein ES332_D09G278900v1 [Gossypium tomentosum]|nr:hypothetical protein ES332_D09G278900v1 [Gossypium tomentosum]